MQIRRKRAQAQVNIVPLVDVLTALIFFFLLTMQFKDIYAVDITPPVMKTSASESSVLPNVLLVDKSGGYSFNGKKTTLAQLGEEFGRIAKSGSSAVLVYADAKTPLEFVTDAVDLARLAKIKKVSLRSNK